MLFLSGFELYPRWVPLSSHFFAVTARRWLEFPDAVYCSTVEPLLTDTSKIRTPLYYGQFVWSQKCQKSYIPYHYNTDTSVKRTLGSVPLVSVLKRFDYTFDGGPKYKTCHSSLSFSQLGYGLNNSCPGEFGHIFSFFFLWHFCCRHRSVPFNFLIFVRSMWSLVSLIACYLMYSLFHTEPLMYFWISITSIEIQSTCFNTY